MSASQTDCVGVSRARQYLLNPTRLRVWLMVGGERMRHGAMVCVGALAAATLLAPSAAEARPLVYGGKMPLTRGVSTIEGAGGGGLANWALITGQETDAGVGGSAFFTQLALSDYELQAYGAAIGLFDRVELSYAHQDFDTGGTGAALGLGAGFSFGQDIYGAKLRLAGDAIYEQDNWLPQLAVGVEYKTSDQGAVITAIGGEDDEGVDYYLAATKVLLEQSLVLSGAVRYTRANQFGILGHGGVGNDDYSAQFEGSVGLLVSDRLLVGAEYRTKPDNLAFAEEEDAFDAFAAYAVNDAVSITLAYVDAGAIATFDDQRGFYVSLQAGF